MPPTGRLKVIKMLRDEVKSQESQLENRQTRWDELRKEIGKVELEIEALTTGISETLEILEEIDAGKESAGDTEGGNVEEGSRREGACRI